MLQELKLKIRLEFKWQDMWIGVFYKDDGVENHIWICLVPMLPIHLTWRTKQARQMESNVSPEDYWKGYWGDSLPRKSHKRK